MIKMTETTSTPAQSTSPSCSSSHANTAKPSAQSKPKPGGKRSGRARPRRRGAADVESGSESDQDGGAESDGSLTSLSDGSDQSDDSDDSDGEEEEEDGKSGTAQNLTLLADANSVPAVWNANSRSKAGSGDAEAEVIQFGDTDALEAAASGKANGTATGKASSTDKREKTRESQKEAKPRRELSEAELAKLKEKRDKRYAKMKEKKQANKAAKALQRQQQQAEGASGPAGEAYGVGKAEEAGDGGWEPGSEAAPTGKAQPAATGPEEDAGSDGGWGPSDPTVSAGAGSVPGGNLDPPPESSTSRTPSGDKSKAGKVKGKKGRKGQAGDADADAHPAANDLASTAAGPSRSRNDKPPRGPRASMPAGDGWGGFDDSQNTSTGPTHNQDAYTGGGRGGRGGHHGAAGVGAGPSNRGRGGFRGGFAGSNGHMGMGMPIRGRGRGAYFSAFAPRYALRPEEEGEKDGRLEMDKIEDEERARRERARAAREEREAREREELEWERETAAAAAAAASATEGHGGEINAVEASGGSIGAEKGDGAAFTDSTSAHALAKGDRSKEDVEAEVDAFSASAAAALDISASTSKSTLPKPAPAPAQPKSSIDGKWGHDAYEQQQVMDQYRSANGMGRGMGRGRGRGRGFGARGGFISPVNGHKGRAPQYASFSSPLATPSTSSANTVDPPAPSQAAAQSAVEPQGEASSSADQLLDPAGPSGEVTVHLPGSGPSVQVPLVPLSHQGHPAPAQPASAGASVSHNATSPAAAAPNPLPPHLTGASHHSNTSQTSNPASIPSQPLSRPGSAATPAFEPAHRSTLSQTSQIATGQKSLNRAHLALLHSQGIGATPTGDYYRLDSGMPVPPGYVQHLLQVNGQSHAQGHQRRSASGSGSRSASASGSGSFVPAPRRLAGVDHASSHGQNVFVPMQSPIFYPDGGMAGADRPLSPFNPYAGTPNTPPLAMQIPVPVAMGVQQTLPGAGYFVPATSGRKVSIRAPGVGEGAEDGGVQSEAEAASDMAANDAQVASDSSEGPANPPASARQQSHTFNPYANGYVPGQVQGPGAGYNYDMQAQMAMQMQMQQMQMGYPDQGQMGMVMGQMDQQGQMAQGYGWYDRQGYYQDNYGY